MIFTFICVSLNYFAVYLRKLTQLLKSTLFNKKLFKTKQNKTLDLAS